MALKPYRRHRKECEGGHSEDARTGQFEEGRLLPIRETLHNIQQCAPVFRFNSRRVADVEYGIFTSSERHALVLRRQERRAPFRRIVTLALRITLGRKHGGIS